MNFIVTWRRLTSIFVLLNSWQLKKKIENKADKKFKRLNISKNDNSKLSSTRHFSQLLEEKQNLHEYAQ